MDLILLAALMRALERLLAISSGLLAIYLGFRLFLALPEVEPGAGRLKLPGGISVYLTRVGCALRSEQPLVTHKALMTIKGFCIRLGKPLAF